MIEKTIRSPNWNPRPNGLRDVYGVILHHTATADGTAIGVAKYFANPAIDVAAHVVIDDNASTVDKIIVVHCVAPEKAAWQAGMCRRYDWDRDGKLEDWEAHVNTHTLGIELVNKGDGRDSFSNAQIKACATIIRRWERICPNLKLRNVTDHQTVNLNGKIDMRPNFPAAKLFWWILHPNTPLPDDGAYSHLPEWAKHQVNEIVRD